MFEIASCGSEGRANRAGARRRHLLDTARALFCENGFHRTGVAQIAAASGVGVGQIYRDFGSKEDIIAAICEADVAAWLDEDTLSDAVAAHDLGAIRRWIGRFGKVKEPVDKCRMMSEIVAEAGRNDRVAAINRTIDARVRRNLEAALSALAPAQEKSADRSQLVDLILALGAGMATRRVVHPELDIAGLDRHMSLLLDRELEALAQ